MATITPHRDAVEQGLEAMREHDRKKGPPRDERERIFRALNLTITAASLGELADGRDRNIDDAIVASAFCSALSTALASFCGTMADADPVRSLRVFETAVQAVYDLGHGRLSSRIEGTFADIVVDEPTAGRA